MGEIVVQMIPIAGANGALKGKELFGETTKNFERRLFVCEEHVAPHGRIRGGDPGEIAETCGGEFDHFLIGHPAQVIGHAHHRVGDEVRDMAHNRTDRVMVIGVHPLNIRSQRAPKSFELFYLGDGGVLGRHDEAPAAIKQLCKTGARAGMFGARHRVRADEMHALGDMGQNGLEHGFFHRAHVAHHRAFFEHGGDIGHHGAHRADGNGKHDEIGVLARGGGAIADLINEANFARRIAGGSRAGKAGNFACHARAAHGQRHRTRDQAEANQGDLGVDHGLRGGVFGRGAHEYCSKNCPATWATRRHAASSPTVIRRQLGRP